MGLVGSLNAAGIIPARMGKVQAFLAAHPGLDEEIREARAAGFTWPQIYDQLARDYGLQCDPSTLADNVEGRRG
jgi:hypothetical protein